MSVMELKAMAYDQMVALQQIQSNLQLINTTINNKLQQAQPTTEPPKVD